MELRPLIGYLFYLTTGINFFIILHNTWIIVSALVTHRSTIASFPQTVMRVMFLYDLYGENKQKRQI